MGWEAFKRVCPGILLRAAFVIPGVWAVLAFPFLFWPVMALALAGAATLIALNVSGPGDGGI